MRKIKSLSPSRHFPASQSLPITPTSPVATVTKKRKKRVVEATKIHPRWHPTKPQSTSRRLAYPSRKFRKHRTQTSKCVVINPRSLPLGVTCGHCSVRQIKMRGFVWLWFENINIDKKKRSHDPKNYKKGL
jgi:hypothetical protein